MASSTMQSNQAMHPKTQTKQLADDMHTSKLSSSVSTTHTSHRDASSPVGGDQEGDTTLLTVFDDSDEPSSPHSGDAGKHPKPKFAKSVRCTPLQLTPARSSRVLHSKLSPKTPRQPVLPTHDKKFKFVEDVKFERNSATYRQQIYRSRHATRDGVSKAEAEARAGKVDYLRFM